MMKFDICNEAKGYIGRISKMKTLFPRAAILLIFLPRQVHGHRGSFKVTPIQNWGAGFQRAIFGNRISYLSAGRKKNAQSFNAPFWGTPTLVYMTMPHVCRAYQRWKDAVLDLISPRPLLAVFE